MVTWEEMDETSAADSWDVALQQSRDYHVYQSFSWGEYKRVTGWTPLRLCARNDDGQLCGMAQLLLKPLSNGITIGWGPAGPVSQFSPQMDLSRLFASLSKRIAEISKRVYCRFDNYLPRSAEQTASLAPLLRPSRAKMNSPFSIYFDLSQPVDALFERASKHHRRDLAKALRADLEWKLSCDGTMVEQLSRLYAEMRQQRRLRIPKITTTDISKLSETFEDRAVILTGFINGAPVSSCLSLVAGTKAVYTVAAANAEGRRTYASYAMLYVLLNELRARGITEFDFGGINPASQAAGGVNYFKRGFGGNCVERIGEWESATSAWLRWPVNFAVACRNLAL
jgi:lipid II:glycine glycyltransferase (peptidoglycan interpeptide bridge formation enzyme)